MLSLAAMLVPCCIADAQTSRYSTWQNPDRSDDQGTTQSLSKDGDRLQQLLDELTKLVDEADRARAADRLFLRDLRDLIDTYDWPWQVQLLHEDFTDGGVSQSPRWTIAAGEFRVERDSGLRSIVRPQLQSQSSTSGNSGQDLAATLLNQLLQQATKQDKSQGQAAAPTSERSDRAIIHVATPITNSFLLRVELSSRQAQGRVEFSLYQRSPEGVGYRLAYQPGGRPSVELLRAGSRGVSVVDAYYESIAPANDTPHTLQWMRDRDGEMTITFDDQEIVRSSDRGLRDPFDGFAITNLGGEFSVKSVTISGTR